MWDRRRTANGSSAAAAAAAAAAAFAPSDAASRPDEHPPALAAPPPLASRSLRATGGVHKHRQRTPRIHGHHHHAHRLDDLDDPLNALGISHNAPCKFEEIRRGKLVPQASPADVPLSSQTQQQHPLTPPPREPPPRNPRRRLLQGHAPQADPSWRPASSIYDESDGSPDGSGPRHPLDLASEDMYGRPAAEEQVSPPSSPDVDAARRIHMTDHVSPIDDEPDRLQHELQRGSLRHQAHPPAQQHRGHTPAPHHAHPFPAAATAAAGFAVPRLQDPPRDRRARNKAPHPAARPLPRTDAMRWEPATGSVPHAVPPSFGGSTTVVSSSAAGQRNAPPPSLGQRMRLMGRSKPEPIAIDDRPPWQGASGRSRQLQPVRDDPAAAPLRLPRRSSRRSDGGGEPSLTGDPAAATRHALSETPNARAATATPRRTPPLTSEQGTSRDDAAAAPYILLPPPIPTAEAGARSYPSPPDDYSAVSPRAATPPSSRASPAPGTRAPCPLVPEAAHRAKAIKRKPPPAASAAPSPEASQLDGGCAFAESSPAHDDGWAPPPSRFSVTTYAPSNPGTPRQPEDEPPVPAIPPQPASVMERRRPIVGRASDKAPAEPIVISMSSPYWEPESDRASADRTARARAAGEEQRQLGRRSSLLSMAKPLPQAPHEKSTSNDRVASLNAQIQGLAHRRVNINRSIKQMTELMPTDNLLASQEVLRKRASEKQKVDALKEELAEIQREEYDLGLKLHRAYKRLDKEAEYEPTTLWVKRVTG